MTLETALKNVDFWYNDNISGDKMFFLNAKNKNRYFIHIMA